MHVGAGFRAWERKKRKLKSSFRRTKIGQFFISPVLRLLTACPITGMPIGMAYKPNSILQSEANDLAIAHLDAMIEGLDYRKVVDHVIASVERQNIKAHPFPYIVLDNVFDEDTYAALLQLVALDDLFYIEEGGNGYTILRYPETNYKLSTSIQAFIEFMAEDLTPALF